MGSGEAFTVTRHRLNIRRITVVTQNSLLNVPYFTGDRDNIYYYGMYIAKVTANQPLAGCGFGSRKFNVNETRLGSRISPLAAHNNNNTGSIQTVD